MLSVVPIKHSSINTGYYLKQDGNYYIEDVQEKELYQWMGKGAERLGLVGAIDPTVHSDVYNGLLPGKTIVGKRNPDGSLAGRPGYDLTFSMNKELSLIVCCTEDKSLKDYFLKAHMNAVKTAMHEVEKMTSARKTLHGVTEYESTKNMIASLCTHFSSRAGDPQIHTHALVANVTERADGQWRALSTDMQRKHGFYEKIRDNATFLGHIYQNEMAIAAREKGFEVKPVNKHGMFAIASFPDDVKEHFSKRRKQILTIIDSLPYANKEVKKLYDHVAQHSKDAKEKINHHDFMVQSKSTMQQFLAEHHTGKNFDALVADCRREKTHHHHPSLTSHEALLDAVNTLSRFSVTFDANRLIEKAMQLDLGSSPIAVLQSSLDQMIQSGFLHKTDSGHFTSQTLMDTEKRLLEKMDQAKKPTPIRDLKTSPTTVVDALKEHRVCVMEEPKSLDAKLSVIDALIHALEANGKKVTLLTQTKSFAFEHNAQDRSQHSSVWQQLKRLGKSDRAESLYGFLHRYQEATSNPMANFLSRPGKEVLLIDEGQSLSLEAAERLIDVTRKREAHLVFLSHASGRQGPLSGNLISLLKKAGVPVIQSIAEKRVMIGTRAKEPVITFHEVHADLNSTNNEKQAHRQATLAKAVVAEYGERLSDIAVVSMHKRAAEKQSDLIRAALKEKGVLGLSDHTLLTERRVYLTPEEQKHAKFFKPGWVSKTYIGRGQFSEKTIVSVDEKNNRLLVKGSFGREKLYSPQQFLKKDGETHLIEKKHLTLAEHDRVRLNTETRLSKQLGLSTTTGYEVAIHDKKITLAPENPKLKTINTRLTRLQGMDWSHDYVKTIAEVRHLKRSSQKVVLDAPAYALDKNTMNVLLRHYDRMDLYTDHQDKAQKKLGIATQKKLASELTTHGFSNDLSDAQKAVNYGLSVIASREAAFTYPSVVEKSLQYGIANVSFEAVRLELKDRVRSGHVMARQAPTGEVLLATTETVQLEKEIINQIQSGKTTVTPFLTQQQVETKLATTSLTDGQKSAVSLLASTSDRFVMVQGYAGTGKSTMLQTLQAALKESNSIPKDSIIALAPTHKAVKELKDKGIHAQTLKSFLVDETHLSENNYQHLAHKLILLDESSMVGNRDFYQLQSMVEKAKTCHCAYIGDTAQLLSVEEGKPAEISYISREADIATAQMTEVLRQKNPALKKVAHALMTSTPESVDRALTALVQNGWVIDASSAHPSEKIIEKKKETNETNETNENTQKVEHDAGPIQTIAVHYCALSEKERNNTVIAAATNKNRQAINEAIRVIRQEKGELQGDAVRATILIDSRLTDAELHHAPNYKAGDVVRLNNQYLTVTQIDDKQNTLILKDCDKQDRVLNLDLMPHQATLELFHRETIEVQAGDRLKWTKSDKERGLVAHQVFQVKEVDKDKLSITALSDTGKVLTIDLSQAHNQHLDYQYAATVHGLQGATAERSFILLDSKNSLSNTMRLLYVAATRSTDEIRLFTDNLETVRDQIVHGSGDKRSALEAMGLLAVKEGMPASPDPGPRSTKSAPTYHYNRSQNTKTSSPNPERLDAKRVEDGLRAEVQHICEALFGEPNRSLSTGTQWRYGRKGSLSVTVTGEYQGSFCNFETGEKGGMIQLFMSELGLDFKSALEEGHRLLGGKVMLKKQNTKPQSAIPVPVHDDAASRKAAYITKLTGQSVPIHGTLAEKYLISRSIQNTDGSDLRFIKRISTGTGNKHVRPFASALLAIAKDKAGNAQALQVTYLHPATGQKLTTLPVSKRTIGSLQEASVNLTPEIQSPKMTFVAEGIETALSIKDAIPDSQKADTQVWVTLGKSNLCKVADERSADKIVLVLDNDKHDWRADKSIQTAMEQIEAVGKSVRCMQPTLLNDQKTDYNDLAKAGRFDEIRQDVLSSMDSIKETAEINSASKLIHETTPPQKNIARSESIDRELFG